MIIFRYLAKEIYSVLLATTIVLLLILMSNQLIQFLKGAASGAYPIVTVLKLLVLQIPFLSGFLLPLGLYLGIVMAYSKLYADNEMTVMFACGLSRARLIGMTVIISSVVFFIVAYLSLYAEPRLVGYQKQVIQQAIASSPLEKSLPNRFQTFDNNKWVFYMNHLSRDKKYLEDVFAGNQMKATNNTTKWQIVRAQQGYQEKNEDGQKVLVLKNGYRYLGKPGHANYQIIKFSKLGIVVPKQQWKVADNIRFYPTGKLWGMRHDNRAAAAELQLRFSLPISVLILALMAFPLSRVKPRQGRFSKFLPAILVYILYADLIFVSQAWVKNGVIPASLGVWWVHLTALLFAFLLIGRQIGWRHMKTTLLSREDYAYH